MRQQYYHQYEWPLMQQRYAQVRPRVGKTTHEKLFPDHAHTWQIFLSTASGGGALLLTLTC